VAERWCTRGVGEVGRPHPEERDSEVVRENDLNMPFT
jgi:hypothetical protein